MRRLNWLFVLYTRGRVASPEVVSGLAVRFEIRVRDYVWRVGVLIKISLFFSETLELSTVSRRMVFIESKVILVTRLLALQIRAAAQVSLKIVEHVGWGSCFWAGVLAHVLNYNLNRIWNEPDNDSIALNKMCLLSLRALVNLRAKIYCIRIASLSKRPSKRRG